MAGTGTCSGCNQTFTGDRPFEMHRVGEHGIPVSRVPHTKKDTDGKPLVAVSTRRCLSPDEMRAKGMMQNAKGQWTTGRDFSWTENL